MATLQAPEIQFAQRLASNEKPIRSKAIKKLRKYIIVRSHKSRAGFTSEELLKLWKGLFYCLWMQDKPLLQEELSNQISGLLHCFQTADGRFQYLEAFLETVKREWTGIDRLRMDKFYQLVRFVFRQTFEMLKTGSWDSSLVSRFLEMLSSQVLQGNGTAPSGLQFHILDLYLVELARSGSTELSADQNLTLIIPFCRIVAKTKDNTLFKAICSSIFSTIIDQAPFAIEDLLREIKAAEHSDSDSGQASQDDEDEEEEEEVMKGSPVGKKSKKKAKGKLQNGIKSQVDEDEDDSQSLDDEEVPDDEGSEPVLQFDYTALADTLFEFASRGNAPSHNRQRLYKIIKILRDLSEGVFPQDDYPEEVSTDEDDEMFGSRRKLKRKGRRHQEEEEEEPAVKKKSGKESEKPTKAEQRPDSADDGEEPTKKKKRKKKKKVVKEGAHVGVAEAGVPMETQDVAEDQSEQASPAAGAADQSEPQAAGECAGKPGKKALRKKGKKSITAAEPTSQAGHPPAVAPAALTAAAPPEEVVSVGTAVTPDVEPATPSTHPKGRKKQNTAQGLVVAEVIAGEAEDAPAGTAVDSAETTPATKRNRRRLRKSPKTMAPLDESPAPAEPADETTTPAKRKKLKGAPAPVEESPVEEVAVCDQKTPTKVSSAPKKKMKKNVGTPAADPPADDVTEFGTPTPRGKKNNMAAVTQEAPEPSPGQTLTAVAAATPASKKKRKKAVVAVEETPPTPGSQRKKKRKIPVVFEFEADEVEAGQEKAVTPPKKVKLQNGAGETPAGGKKPKSPGGKKPKSPGKALISFQKSSAPTPLFFKTKGTPGTPQSKKPQTPKSEAKKVTFGLKNNKTAEFRKSDRILLLSPEGPSRVPFDPTQKPKCGVLKSPGPASPMVYRKTPKPNKTGALTRPTAADFF